MHPSAKRMSEAFGKTKEFGILRIVDLVPRTGLEPANPCGRQPLKLMRLPINSLPRRIGGRA